MKFCLRWLAVVLFVASSCPSAYARDYFVNNRLGDDHNSGGGESTAGAGNGPTRTIGRALLLADRGDRIIIANSGEPYREGLTLQGAHHSGTELRPFTILGNGAVLDGSVAVPDSDWLPFEKDVVRFHPPRRAFQTFFIEDQPAQRAKLNFAELAQLEAKQWALVDGFIYFRAEPNRLLSSYNARYGGHPVGITLYDVHDIQIFDLQVKGFQLDGINAHDNVRQASLTAVDASNNGRSGISVGGSCRVELFDCSGGGNGVAQVRTEGFCRVEVVGGTFNAASGPAIDSREGGKIITEE